MALEGVEGLSRPAEIRRRCLLCVKRRARFLRAKGRFLKDEIRGS
jgi:hypothetical protein